MKRILFITDPWLSLDHQNDTTLLLIRASQKLKHQCFWADTSTITIEGKSVLIKASLLKNGFTSETPKNFKTFKLDTFQYGLYRVDPPVDLYYLQNLLLLKTSDKNPVWINSLDLLMTRSEKLETLRAGVSTPPSLVSHDLETILEFIKKTKDVVLKPLHEAQSHGIFRITGEPSPHQVHQIALATNGYRLPVLIQKYLKEIKNGEARVWYLDGKVIGVIKKFPKRGDFKVDLDRGSEVTSLLLAGAVKKNAEKLGKYLKSQKIRIAAADFIGNDLTDLNFTSPGLLTKIEQLIQKDLASNIIKKLIK